jgi:hypothetical protein
MLKQSGKQIAPTVRYVLIGAIILVFIFIFLFLGNFSSNITGFFRIGSVLPLSPYLDLDRIFIFSGELGYDGQQFLTIALDPGLKNPDSITALDHPTYRYRRIFYPLLGHVLGLGNSALIPYTMVGINLISILLLIGLVSAYFQNSPQQQWQSLFVLCIPGLWISLSLSTADILSSLLLAIAIYSYAYRKPWWVAIALSLGSLTRETLLLAWLGIAWASLGDRRRDLVIPLAVTPIPFILWNLYVKSRALPGESGAIGNLGLPFVGFWQKGQLLIAGGFTPKTIYEVLQFGLLLAIAAAIFWLYRRYPQNNRVIYCCAVLICTILALTTTASLNYFLNYARVFMDLYLLSILSFEPVGLSCRKVLLGMAGSLSFVFLVAHS